MECRIHLSDRMKRDLSGGVVKSKKKDDGKTKPGILLTCVNKIGGILHAYLNELTEILEIDKISVCYEYIHPYLDLISFYD